MNPSVPSPTPLHVACAANEAYLPHCATMLLSLFAHNDPGATTVHFLHAESLSPTETARLTHMVEDAGAQMRCHSFTDESVSGLSSPPGVQPVMWYRTMLPDRVPELDRILYLDADTLVVGDLRPLWETNLEGSVLAAVTNVTPTVHRAWPESLGIVDPQRYFNSGVMVMDLERMRADAAADRLIGFGRGRDLKWWDQDALNVVYSEQRRYLHPRWNCMNALYLTRDAQEIFGDQVVVEACRDPAIVHFEGPGAAKPWHYLSKHPYRADYLRFRASSPWPLAEFEGVSAFNRLLRPLPMRGIIWVLGARFRVERATRRLRRRIFQRTARLRHQR